MTDQQNNPHPWTKGSVVSAFKVMHDLLGIKYQLLPKDPSDLSTMQLVVSNDHETLYAISEDTNPYDLVKIMNLGIPTALSVQAAMKMARSGGNGLQVLAAPVGYQFVVMDDMEIDGKRRMIWGAIGQLARIPSVEANNIIAVHAMLTSFKGVQVCVACRSVIPEAEGQFVDYPGFDGVTMFICNNCQEKNHEGIAEDAVGTGEVSGEE